MERDIDNNTEIHDESGVNLIRQNYSPTEVEEPESDPSLIDEGNNKQNSNESHAISLVTLWCLIPLIYPILCHFFDFVSDICLTIEYFKKQKTGEGSLTLAFTMLQATASAWISFLMHHPKWTEACAEETNDKTEANWVKKIAKHAARYSVVIMFQRALPLCRLRKLYYACKTRQCQQKGDKVLQNRYHRKMLDEDRDSAALEVVDCFMQSAPQLVLQLYILLTQKSAISEPMWFKIVTGSVALFSMSTTMKEYHCATRAAQPDKVAISEEGGDLILLWHLGTIAARILVIGIAASTWLLYTSLACAINWVGWTAWIYSKENVITVLHGKYDESSSNPHKMMEKLRNLLLAGVLSTVYTFTFINLGRGRTFVKNSVYYILCLWQNGTVVLLWFTITNLNIESGWFLIGLLLASVILFVIGIAAMITYYLFFHPNLQNKNKPAGDSVGIV